MPPKGKVCTKGQKQIVAENKDTLQYYLYIIGGVNALYFVVQVLLFWESYTILNIILSMLAAAAYFASYKFMATMARATYSPEGSLIDGGVDINMESGMGEHSKDLIILTAIVQTLSLISRYFWLLWLLAPGRAFYLLWVNILGPWFFEPAPEVDEKKAKKMERKMKRR